MIKVVFSSCCEVLNYDTPSVSSVTRLRTDDVGMLKQNIILSFLSFYEHVYTDLDSGWIFVKATEIEM